jgi:integrase/recombinase XerD
MLTLYRRHLTATDTRKACPYSLDRFYRRCKCPVWAEGTTRHKGYIRISLKTASWEDAEKAKRLLEDGETPQSASKTVSDAVDSYLANKRVENKAEGTLRIATRRLGEFNSWCAVEGFKYLSELKVEDLRRFREGWACGSNTAANKQGTIYAFFQFCADSEWIPSNTAAKLSKIKVETVETGYFTPDEFDRIIEACSTMRGKKGARVKALILLMRWTGLRISDAVGVGRDRLNGEELFLYARKNGTPVFSPLPPHVLDALAAMPSLPDSNRAYYFWTGTSKIETCANVWRRSLMTVFKKAGITKRCHPHMLRDTFAVEALLAGVPIDQVSMMLGHSSIKITEEHYMPFVAARQQQLSSSIRRMWPAAGGASASA